MIFKTKTKGKNLENFYKEKKGKKVPSRFCEDVAGGGARVN